jgi:FtsH-binding integral membrane protein
MVLRFEEAAMTQKELKKWELSKWMIGGLAATSLAGLLTAIGGNLEARAAHQAAVWLVLGFLPQLFFLVISSEPERYKVGFLAQWLVVFSFFFTAIGLYLLIRAYDENAGFAALVTGGVCMTSLFKAEDRMKAWRKRQGSPAGIGNPN